jgi:hypothetical protein
MNNPDEFLNQRRLYFTKISSKVSTKSPVCIKINSEKEKNSVDLLIN